ncbi:MAG: hypothetical protein N4A33_04575 [Bacteriovoracaceae bacterium]|jgi:hypothetical protein|nr:hypothetical protein [Bacteriovoracaceae bacterium]
MHILILLSSLLTNISFSDDKTTIYTCKNGIKNETITIELLELKDIHINQIDFESPSPTVTSSSIDRRTYFYVNVKNLFNTVAPQDLADRLYYTRQLKELSCMPSKHYTMCLELNGGGAWQSSILAKMSKNPYTKPESFYFSLKDEEKEFLSSTYICKKD